MSFDENLDATVFNTAKLRYKERLEELLDDIYNCYKIMASESVKIKKDENKIRDMLVDNYLVPRLKDYTFKKEKYNSDGRVDIYIIDKLYDDKPHFIIECKLLDEKNTKDSLSGKYISNGILRFLTEHYYLDNRFYTNAMIGFIIQELDEDTIVDNINSLSQKILRNIVEIQREITVLKSNIYLSIYETGKPIKVFNIYHLMLNVHKNIK